MPPAASRCGCSDAYDERNPASLGSTPQTISAPNGIAIGGGTVTNPVVNNFSPPERHLTPQQIDALASIPPCDTPESVVAVVWEPDPEAVNYAGDFTAPLQSIHCLGYRAPLQSRPPLIHGITLVAADWSRANATAERLRDAMTKAGIAFTVETGNITMGEAATVVVGVR